MPQLHLPMFPTGVTHITSELAFEKKDGCITYFNGHMPVGAPYRKGYQCLPVALS